MSWDLAFDYNTGDLIISPTNDFSVRTGSQVSEQRIRVRLRCHRGDWVLDPTDGQLGSNMLALARMPMAMAITDAPRVVREALEPMDDIKVHDVHCTIDPDDSHVLDILIEYGIVESGGETVADEQFLSTSISITE